MIRRYPREISPPAIKNARLESYKMVFELMKHLTALSSGSILILIALLEKVFETRPPTWIVVTALVLFCLSIVLAGVAMLLLAVSASDGKLSNGERNVYATCAACAFGAFVIGIGFVTSTAVLGLK